MPQALSKHLTVYFSPLCIFEENYLILVPCLCLTYSVIYKETDIFIRKRKIPFLPSRNWAKTKTPTSHSYFGDYC